MHLKSKLKESLDPNLELVSIRLGGLEALELARQSRTDYWTVTDSIYPELISLEFYSLENALNRALELYDAR